MLEIVSFRGQGGDALCLWRFSVRHERDLKRMTSLNRNDSWMLELKFRDSAEIGGIWGNQKEGKIESAHLTATMCPLTPLEMIAVRGLSMETSEMSDEWRQNCSFHSFPSSDCPSTQGSTWTAGMLYALIPNRLSFTAHHNDDQTMTEIKRHPDRFYFSTDCQEQYSPFCEDFGPVDIATLVRFCHRVRSHVRDGRLANRHLVYYFDNDMESASNASFLLSAYLMLEHRFSIDDAVKPFTGLDGCPVVPFRDASNSKSTFDLTVRDCLCGLSKAVEQGWFDLDNFDVDKYDYMADPAGGDMHRICPKLIACRGPEEHARSPNEAFPSMRPDDCVAGFKRLGVTTVVRLNDPETYDKTIFEGAGFEHCDVFFGDSATPTGSLLRKFLNACDAADGVVAVHCRTGLGRTGTMIGAWLMRSCGWSVREAIAWLRIVRPGSVIGAQQHYLASMESRLLTAFRCSSDGCLTE